MPFDLALSRSAPTFSDPAWSKRELPIYRKAISNQTLLRLMKDPVADTHVHAFQCLLEREGHPAGNDQGVDLDR